MFTDEDVERCAALLTQPVQPTGTDEHRRATVRRIMEETANLLAARGGTLPAHRVATSINAIAHRANYPTLAEQMREHISTQGAHLTLLQSALNDVAEIVMGERPVVVTPSSTVNFVRSLKAEHSGAVAVAKVLHDKHATLLDLLLPYATGEEGNGDVVGRVKRLLKEHDDALRLLAARVDASRLDEATSRAEQAEERVRQLAVAGQALSEHVDRTTVDCPPPCPGHLNSGHVHDAEATGRRPENDADTFRTVPNGTEGAIFTRTQLEHAREDGAEAMRAACLNDIREALANIGAWDRETSAIVIRAIEGAAP